MGEICVTFIFIFYMYIISMKLLIHQYIHRKEVILMGRSIPHNSHTSPELLAQVNPTNQMLLKDFIEYMDSTGKSDTTLIGYKQDLNIAFCWNLRFNGNKEFQLWTKRDIQRYQSYMVVECHISCIFKCACRY